MNITERQIEAVKLRARGLPNKAACRELGIAPDTFKELIAAARESLGVAKGVPFCVVALKAERMGLLEGVEV